MSRWLVGLGVVVLALLGVLLWQLRENPSDRVENVAKGSDASDTSGDVGPARTPDAGEAASAVKVVRPQNSTEVDAGRPKELIDPKSELFNYRIDVAVGNLLRKSAAFECDESGIDPNAKITVGYHLKLVNGRGSVTKVKVLESEVTKEYEECFVRHISGSTFTMSDMPDFEEGEQKLFTKVRSMKKYRDRVKFERGE